MRFSMASFRRSTAAVRHSLVILTVFFGLVGGAFIFDVRQQLGTFQDGNEVLLLLCAHANQDFFEVPLSVGIGDEQEAFFPVTAPFLFSKQLAQRQCPSCSVMPGRSWPSTLEIRIHLFGLVGLVSQPPQEYKM